MGKVLKKIIALVSIFTILCIGTVFAEDKNTDPKPPDVHSSSLTYHE